MTFRPQETRCVIGFVGVATLLAAVGVFAQEPPKDAAKAERSIREQDIYIPYEKLRQVFEKHGRGVFLPYEQFQELWQAALEKTRPAAEAKPPVGALITEISNEATVEKDVVRVKAKVEIEVLAAGWNEVSLRLADAAITSAAVDGQPARIIGGPAQDYRLLVEHKGKEPKQIELALEYAKAITRTPGQNSVSFQAPQAPVSRWRLTIPQAGVKVNLYPLIAATEVPVEKVTVEKRPEGTEAAQKADETVVLAYVGAAPVVRIDWTPKAEGATGMAAMASVQAQQQLWIGEGVVRTRTALTYAISRAELGQLTIDVPADQKVVNVFDANVRQWSVEPVGGRQRITAQLFEPAKSAQQVTVELEKFTGDKPNETIEVPLVKAVGPGQQLRQQGVLVVQVAEGLRAEAAKQSGLLQIDAGELPAALAPGKWAFAYRYATADYRLALSVEKVQPEVAVDSLVEADLEPERLSLSLVAIYTIEKAGVFRLDLDIPAGYEVQQVQGTAVAQAAPVQVDAYRLENEKKTRLVVNLTRKAIGRVALAVQLQKELNLPDLLVPTGKTAEIALSIPVVAPSTVERAAGRLVIYAPESLRVNPGKMAGLRSVSFQEAFEGMQSVRGPKPGDRRPVLAFAYTQETNVVGQVANLSHDVSKLPQKIALSLAAERRKPQVTVRQLLVARVEEGVVKYQITFFYNVLYSGVKSLQDRRAGRAGRRAARRHAWGARECDRSAAGRIGQKLRRLEACRRVGVDGRRPDRTQLREEDRETRDRQERRVVVALFETPGSRPRLGANRAGEIGNHRRSRVGRTEVAPAHRSAARSDEPRGLGRPRLRVPRRLDADDRRHAVSIGGGQTDQHRAGGGADGSYARQNHFGAGALSDAERATAVGGRAARRGRLRHPTGADRRPAGDAGEGAAERVLRAAGKRKRRHALCPGASLHGSGRRQPARLAQFPARAGGRQGIPLRLSARDADPPGCPRAVERRVPVAWRPRDAVAGCRPPAPIGSSSGFGKESSGPSSPAQDFQTDGQLYVYSTLCPAPGPKARWK